MLSYWRINNFLFEFKCYRTFLTPAATQTNFLNLSTSFPILAPVPTLFPPCSRTCIIPSRRARFRPSHKNYQLLKNSKKRKNKIPSKTNKTTIFSESSKNIRTNFQVKTNQRKFNTTNWASLRHFSKGKTRLKVCTKSW